MIEDVVVYALILWGCWLCSGCLSAAATTAAEEENNHGH